MKLLASTTASLLATLTLSPTAADAAQAPHPLHPKFQSQLKCPYAENWLTKGADAAAQELGIDISLTHEDQSSQRRKLVGSELPIAGSCNYANTWTGEDSCMNFHGESWTLEAMIERCDTEQDGVATQGVGCEDTADNVSGWCVKDVSESVTSMMSVPEVKEEATLMMLSAMSSCENNEMACTAFVLGKFVAAGSCVKEGSGASDASDEADTTTMEGNKCMIAPGAIGAAHQAGFSKGYSSNCPNTPAQDSPYMWPLKWAANFQQKSMSFGSDEVKYEARGKTFYALDKNWKRSDTTYQLGVWRTVGMGPCEDFAGDSDTNGRGCVLNNTDTMSTMIHKENMMYFVDWNQDAAPIVGENDISKIESCSYINMAVVGNIRADWFMDKRGDDTDVQYLGDQHLFYPDPEEGTIPMLAKQWRKKDFASQYFTMSMLANPENKVEKMSDASGEDNYHWPMILNIPGEGFGDDHLHVYTNHELLTNEDDDLFMLVENYIENGGECPEFERMNGEDEIAVGPPVQEVHIPSNLEVEEASWVSNEYTFSPVWQAPMRPVVADMGAATSVSAAISKPSTKVSDRMTVESCYDEATKSIDMSFHFHDIDPAANGRLPWMAIGYRSSDVCAMTPPSGGVTPIVLITHLEGDGEDPKAHSTSLLPTAKTLSSDAFASMYMLARDLEETEDHFEVSVIAPQITTSIMRSSLTDDDTVSISFKRVVEEKPEQLNLMYAIGMTSELGIHTTRKCFVIDTFPSCSSPVSGAMGDVNGKMMEDTTIKVELGSSSATAVMMSTFAFALSCMVGVAVWF